MNDESKLHIVMFPWLAFGHIIPFLNLSKHLATKGHHISFISTPRNLQRLPKIPQSLASRISLIPLSLPRDANLPPDADATADIPFNKHEFLKRAYDGLQEPLSRFLEASSPPVDWIIYDFSNYWVPQIADKLNIKKVFFQIISGWSYSAFGPSSKMIKDCESDWSDPRRLTKPLEWVPFPNNIVYWRLYEAKLAIGGWHKNASGVSDVFRSGSSVKGCDVMAIRSCRELEDEYLQLLEKLHGKPVIPVGLLPVSVGEEEGQEDTWQSLVGWLDNKGKGSLVYVALGSEVAPSQEQLTELALGLEMSELPFIWAFRKPVGERLELPEGFEGRTRGRGVVWTGWAPQPRILSHDSVGAFLSHCGWNSVIEGLQIGRPLIMLPFVLDQGFNARVMEEKRVGIEIPRNDEDGSFTRSSVAESLKKLLVDEAGTTYKDEAKKMSRVVGDINLHTQYVDKFEEYLYSHRPTHKG